MDKNKDGKQKVDNLENKQSLVEKQMKEVGNMEVKSERIRFKHADELYD